MAEAHHLLPEAEATRAIQAGAVLIFAGLGLKMGLVPMHFWLPDAYQQAPSSVNSLISPIMTKVAAYAMLRMFLSVFPDGYLIDIVPIADALVVLGLIGITFGSIAAASQTDIRRMLAYSSISQLALIAVGIGLATPLAFVAALLHIVNHAAMKSTLFLAAASIRLEVGLQKIPNLAGLGRRMPVTMAAFTIAAISMVGIPPTAGFFSKWYMIQAGLDLGQWPVVIVVLLSSLLTAVYLFKVLEQAYLKPASSVVAQDEQEDTISQAIQTKVTITKESHIDVWAPLVVLAASIIAIGVFNVVIIDHILRPGVS